MRAKNSLRFCLILLSVLVSLSFPAHAAATEQEKAEIVINNLYSGFMEWCIQPAMSRMQTVPLARKRKLQEFSALQAAPFLKYRRGIVFLLPSKVEPVALVVFDDDDVCQTVAVSGVRPLFWQAFEGLFKGSDAPFSAQTVDKQQPGYDTQVVHGYFDHNIVIRVQASAPIKDASGTYKLSAMTLSKSSVFQTQKK